MIKLIKEIAYMYDMSEPDRVKLEKAYREIEFECAMVYLEIFPKLQQYATSKEVIEYGGKLLAQRHVMDNEN